MPVEVGESDEPIPIHFAYRRDITDRRAPAGSRTGRCAICSTRPTSPSIDDTIVNGTLRSAARRAAAARSVPRRTRRLFAAPALSLHRD